MGVGALYTQGEVGAFIPTSTHGPFIESAMIQPWGASPADWQHWVQLGVVADLLPVVSNPTAKISALSKMRDLGKTPSRYNRDREAVGIPAWTAHQTTERQVTAWARDTDLGICVQTRRLRAIDVDIADPAQAAKVAEYIEMGLGVLPRRQRSDSGKFLLVIDMPGDFQKRILRTPHGAIEFLATGQQFVAVGTHPKGQRYEWVGGLPAEVPEVTPAELDALWSILVSSFGIDGGVTTRPGVAPSVPRSALDMHGDPMVAWLQENDWVREWDRDGRVHIVCPWTSEHTSDSGPSSTSYFPAGVGGIDAGHFKCLHAHCAHRTDDAFRAAMGFTTQEFEVQVLQPASVEGGPAEAPWPAFTRDKLGRIECTATNVQAALRRPDITGLQLGWDQFLGARVIAEAGASTWRLFKDSDYFVLRVALEARGFKAPGAEIVREAVRQVSEEGSFDSAIQWATGLEWDGVERVERFFSTHMGAADSPYTRAVARYMWTALAGRCLTPGEKVDMVPVLISPQGTGKTSMVEALAPTLDAFAEINLEHRDEQLSRQLRGKLVGEIAELRGLMTRDAESIKAWITRKHEEIRGLYAEFHAKYPRRLVFIGTSNPREFLDDETGERRWLPLRVNSSDTAKVIEDRDQLWAEGVRMYRAQGVEWRGAQTLAVTEHEAYKVGDSWVEVIGQWLETDGMDGHEGPRRGDEPFSLQAVALGALGLDARNLARKDELRIGKVLRMLGFEKKVWRVGKVLGKRWARVDSIA